MLNIAQRSQLQYCRILRQEASCNMVEASSISLPSHLTAATIICTRNFANFCKFVKLTKCGLAGMEVNFQQFCMVSFQSSDTFLLAFRSWALSDSAQQICGLPVTKEDVLDKAFQLQEYQTDVQSTTRIWFWYSIQPSNCRASLNHPRSHQKFPKSCNWWSGHISFTGPHNFSLLFSPPSPSEYEYSDADGGFDKPNSGIG